MSNVWVDWPFASKLSNLFPAKGNVPVALCILLRGGHPVDILCHFSSAQYKETLLRYTTILILFVISPQRSWPQRNKKQ